MNFFDNAEAELVYLKCRKLINPYGILIIKHQMGKHDDVIVDGYSNELGRHYYSNYRSLQTEISMLQAAGFHVVETVDVYPDSLNRWQNTHFYGLICQPITI